MYRVVAYCRVSTDLLDQLNSLENQKYYFQNYIKTKDNWKLIGIYSDEGITGTNIEKRKSFLSMIDAAKNHEFDYIITKEISRFARNTLDSIYYTRLLKQYGVGVIFLNDHINTLDGDSEFRLTLMASIAQEESRKTSERVKWGQRIRMKQGVVFGHGLYGYDIVDGNLVIRKDEAVIVKSIFYQYVVEKKGTYQIAKELIKQQVPCGEYMKQWTATMVLRILKNEKYCGDLVQQKTYTPDYLSHKKQINEGSLEKVVCLKHHPPIVSKELFDLAQKEINKRCQKGKTKYSVKHCFSNKIICASCKKTFSCRSKKRKDSSIYYFWRNCNLQCSNCKGYILNDQQMQYIVQNVFRKMLEESEQVEKEIERWIETIYIHNKKKLYHKESEIKFFLYSILKGEHWDDVFYQLCVKNIEVINKKHFLIYFTFCKEPYEVYYEYSK